MQKPRELTELLDLLREKPPKYALEIGGMKGGTAWAWSKIGARVVVVDMFVLEGRLELGPKEYDLVEGDSHLETTRNRVIGLPYDFLFIDGDHSYAGVRRDFELYAPLIQPGGVIALHDVSAEQPVKVRHAHDIVPYWNQVRQLYEHHEIHDSVGEVWWGGIGVLRVPEEPARTEALVALSKLGEPTTQDRVATVPCDEPCAGGCGHQLAPSEEVFCATCAAAR